MTEGQLQNAVLQIATILGWRSYHTFDSRRSQAGFPDLVLVRERVIYAELKTATGKPSPEQVEWAQALTAAGQDVRLWRPDDLNDEIPRALARGGR